MFDDNWIYIHSPDVLVGRIQNFKSWSPEMIPDPAFNCLGLEYFCFEGDALWDAADSDLIALAKKEVAQIGLVAAADQVSPDFIFSGEGQQDWLMQYFPVNEAGLSATPICHQSSWMSPAAFALGA